MRPAAWMRALLLASFCLVPLGCGAKAEKNKDTDRKAAEPEAEVKIEDISLGNGPEVAKGDFVEIHYTGTLPDGTVFDSSVDRQEPLVFRVGYGQVIKGMDKGITGMKEGGKRRITIPPSLGYGSRGSGEKIPPNSTLIFDIDLLKVTK